MGSFLGRALIFGAGVLTGLLIADSKREEGEESIIPDIDKMADTVMEKAEEVKNAAQGVHEFAHAFNDPDSDVANAQRNFRAAAEDVIKTFKKKAGVEVTDPKPEEPINITPQNPHVHVEDAD